MDTNRVPADAAEVAVRAAARTVGTEHMDPAAVAAAAAAAATAVATLSQYCSNCTLCILLAQRFAVAFQSSSGSTARQTVTKKYSIFALQQGGQPASLFA